MKPILVEYIPLYGLIKYFERYDAKRRTAKESLISEWVQLYHMVSIVTCLLILIFLIKYLVISI